MGKLSKAMEATQSPEPPGLVKWAIDSAWHLARETLARGGEIAMMAVVIQTSTRHVHLATCDPSQVSKDQFAAALRAIVAQQEADAVLILHEAMVLETAPEDPRNAAIDAGASILDEADAHDCVVLNWRERGSDVMYGASAYTSPYNGKPRHLGDVTPPHEIHMNRWLDRVFEPPSAKPH